MLFGEAGLFPNTADRCPDREKRWGIKMMKMKKRLRRGLALLLAAALCCACVSAAADGEQTQYVANAWNFVDRSMDVSQGIPSNAEGVLAKIRETGKLRVATEPYYPPHEFIDPAKSGQEAFVGADMELARLMARRMGVELEIVPMDFSQVLTAVADGDCDLAISALAYTPGRAAQVTMSKGYYFGGYDQGSTLLIRTEDKEKITGVGDLGGRVIVAQSGSVQEALAAEQIQAYLEFRRLPAVQDVFRVVQESRADAAIVDTDAALRYIQRAPQSGLTLVSDVHFLLDSALIGDRVAGKKGEYQLMYFVNGVLDEALADGQYDRWVQEYEAYAARIAQ